MEKQILERVQNILNKDLTEIKGILDRMTPIGSLVHFKII